MTPETHDATHEFLKIPSEEFPRLQFNKQLQTRTFKHFDIGQCDLDISLISELSSELDELPEPQVYFHRIME